MKDDISQFLILYIEKKGKLPKDIDINTFNYIDSGYIDSMALIKFVVEIEAKFDIEISEEDMLSPEFRTIGELTSIIKQKLK